MLKGMAPIKAIDDPIIDLVLIKMEQALNPAISNSQNSILTTFIYRHVLHAEDVG